MEDDYSRSTLEIEFQLANCNLKEIVFNFTLYKNVIGFFILRKKYELC